MMWPWCSYRGMCHTATTGGLPEVWRLWIAYDLYGRYAAYWPKAPTRSNGENSDKKSQAIV